MDLVGEESGGFFWDNAMRMLVNSNFFSEGEKVKVKVSLM